jgi:tetratricopeptide (TPR) repeat protein
MTGRYDAAVTSAQTAEKSGAAADEAAWVGAEALRRRGRLEEAVAWLTPHAAPGQAYRARLLLGEILLDQGKRREGQAILISLVEDYNSDRIREGDATALACVGRAAHRLDSPHDANRAFDEAERARPGATDTLLFRAELFLDKHDAAHAEEVTREVLEHAPEHPEALVWLAQVKLAQTFDFDEAERLAKRALAVNPRLARAHFVLAGIALRDLELDRADRIIDDGLRASPEDLELLSLRAAVRFLADDSAGFEAAKRAVLAKHASYARLFDIVGDFAEWEHRYDEIVKLMREAVLVDGDDPRIRAALGIHLIRAGDDTSGVSQLRLAFDADPFNVRVYNTLNLYERVIPAQYESQRHGTFVIRYHRDERAVLERYVPGLLDRAWETMQRRYGFTPETPISVELYPSREHFSIRTSGLPNVGIQGVCFGRTFASMTPRDEHFNLGMTLWHELSHVFHIQLSRSHVPRWFTEGLAEWETLITRPEWRREHDPELYEALRSGRLPQLASMNRAFTRAERIEDMATAYYASTRILAFFVERYGSEKLAAMLAAWGAGQRTPAVLVGALGATPEALDAAFVAHQKQELERFAKQYVPPRRVPPLERARALAQASPKDARLQAQYALAALQGGDAKALQVALQAGDAADRRHPDLRWVAAQAAAKARDADRVERILLDLRQDGFDGYEPRMLLAEVADGRKDLATMKEALEAAHRFDPLASEPLAALASLAREAGDVKFETDVLFSLTRLEQHEPAPYQRLLRLLVDQKRAEEAVRVGEAAVWVDVTGPLTHQLYAEALMLAGKREEAVFELESATRCPARPEARADAHAQLAETYFALGKPALGRRHVKEARALDPNNARLAKLAP